VLAAGWLLGGSVGVGTVVYALAIGPLVQLLLPYFLVPAREPARITAGDQAAGGGAGQAAESGDREDQSEAPVTAS
jgi:hypothetical protein